MQGKRGPLETWDESFYKAKLQMAKFNLSDEDIRPYFALPTVLDGMHSVRVPHMHCTIVPQLPDGRLHSSRVAIGAALRPRYAAPPRYH